nr:putative reverse transcriptase domain-containing protein [Tanacetum cinerariifolium]
MVIKIAYRSMQSPKGIAENVLVKIYKFIFPVDFVNLDVIEDNKVLIILGRPMLTTAHARIDVFGGKISLEVGTEQIIFKTNEGASPSTVIPVYILVSIWILLGKFKTDNNMGIKIDDFAEGMEDLLDDLDPGVLTNNIVNPPFKPEFFSVGNRVHRRSPYNR